MPIRVSARTNAELRGTVLAIKTLDRDLRKQLRRGTKEVAGMAWGRELTRRASTTLEHRVLADTARVAVSDQNVRIIAAGARRRVTSGGLRPIEYGRAIEFGANRAKRSTYRATRRGTTYTITRRTAAQLRPRRKGGYVFFPAAAEMIPRLLAMWTQTTVRTIHEAFEGRRG